MNKKYVVLLTDEERGICQDMLKKFIEKSQRFRRAQILLKADVTGPGGLMLKSPRRLSAVVYK